MAMAAANAENHLSNDINVTPMIDVLLVLLIIFMMIIPQGRKALDLQLPDPTPTVAPANQNPDQIILAVNANKTYNINKEVVPRERLNARLHEIYDNRPDKIAFIKGDSNVVYQDVIFLMDVARGAGVKVLGLAPKETK